VQNWGDALSLEAGVLHSTRDSLIFKRGSKHYYYWAVTLVPVVATVQQIHTKNGNNNKSINFFYILLSSIKDCDDGDVDKTKNDINRVVGVCCIMWFGRFCSSKKLVGNVLFPFFVPAGWLLSEEGNANKRM
jgi:hypothetical protein